MSIKKIKINQLKVGMFIVAIDISWIRSPFLKHSRLIKNTNDIKLLIQAGVKEVSIDVSKTQIQKTPLKDDEATKAKTTKAVEVESKKTSQHEEEQCSHEIITKEKEPNQAPSKQKPSSLSQELETATVLKHLAQEALENLSEDIKNNIPLKAKVVLPVINDSIDSLMRNNQALLTLMHMKRNKVELFTHSFSVMSLALSLAISLDYSVEQLRKIGTAALLHDLGWFKLPLNLLSKNQKYSENEIKVIQQHIFIIIQQLSSGTDSDEDVIKIISEHHERGDGSGYPKGLKLEQLSQEGSLLALVDSYDELTHGLSDNPGVIPSRALKILYKDAINGQFYKSQVEQLITLLGIYPLTSAVKLKTGEKAVVTEINVQSPLKPLVKVFYDKVGQSTTKPYDINLINDAQKREIGQLLDLNDSSQDPLGLLIVQANSE